MALLPYEKTYAVDMTRGIPSVTPPPSLNIASVISSDTGPVEILEIKNQQELINNYCTGSTISATDNETIQFNGALLSKARVNIVRADTSSMRVGRGSTGTLMYFNKEYALLDTITVANISRVAKDFDTLWVTVENEEGSKVTYYLGEKPEVEAVAIDLAADSDVTVRVTIKNFFDLLLARGICLSVSDTKATFLPKVVEISDNMYVFKSEDKFYSELPEGSINKLYTLKDELDDSISINVGAYTYYNEASKGYSGSSDYTPIALSYKSYTRKFTSPIFLLLVAYDIMTSNKLVKPFGLSARVVLGEDDDPEKIEAINDIIKIKEILDKAAVSDKILKITDAVDYDKGPSIYYKNDNVPDIVVSSTSEAIKYEAGTIDNLYEVIHATDSTNESYFKSDVNYIVIDDTCYYAATSKPDLNNVVNYICVKDEPMSVSEFIDATFELMLNTYTLGKGPNNKFVLAGTHTINASDNIKIAGYKVVNQTGYDDAFAIVCKFTSNQPLFTFSYEQLNDDYDSIDFTYNFKDVSENFKFSFDGNSLDGTGSSLYYEKYNEDPDFKNNYIHITKLEGNGVFTKHKQSAFGNELLNNPVTEAAYSEAILKFLETKEKQYQFVTDAGHCSVALANACKQVADEKFAQYIPSIPPTLKDVDEIKSYVTGLNLDDFRCLYLVPGHKSTYNGNFLTTVPASLSYMFARINAFQTVSGEFEPIFGTRKGSVAAPNLIKFFDDEEAQELADQNINVITKDMAGTYIRSNFTSQKVNSYLSEDQNSYMTNIISQVCEAYNPEIIAEANTVETRQTVTNTLTSRISERMIAGKANTLARFKVVCDSNLNTTQVVESRQLIYQVWVQFNPSVAYVLAYVHVKRLGTF